MSIKQKKQETKKKPDFFSKIREKISNKTALSFLSLGVIFLLFLLFVYWDGWEILTYLSTLQLVLLTGLCFFCFAFGHVFFNPGYRPQKPLSLSGFRWAFAFLIFFWFLFFFLTTGRLEILKHTIFQFIIHILKIILLFYMFMFLVYPRRMKNISKLSFRIFKNHIRLKWWIFQRALGKSAEEKNPTSPSLKPSKKTSEPSSDPSSSGESDLSLSYMALSTVCLLSLIIIRGVLQQRGEFYDFMIISFALFLILFRNCVQRLKDLNVSVWWILWLWIPFGNLYFVYRLLSLQKEKISKLKKT